MRPPMLYEQTDIPEGMTCVEFRRSRRRVRRRWLSRLPLPRRLQEVSSS